MRQVETTLLIKFMDERDFTYDYIRAISTLMIVACHICYTSAKLFFLGVYFSSYVEVFFIISAILLGLKYNKKKLNWQNFLKFRVTRIVSSYYPFLLFLFGGIYLFSGDFTSLKTIIAHVTFVQWFTRSFDYSYGHLWFLSMIMLCYVFISMVSQIKAIRLDKFLIVLSILLIGLLGYLYIKLKLPPRIVITLITFTYFFFQGSNFIKFSKKIMFLWYFPIYLIINLISISIFYKYNGLIEYKLYGSFLVTLIAISNVLILTCIFRSAKENRIVTFLSAISFEIYLIHHPLILGKYAIVNYFNYSKIANISITLLIIVIFSWLLNYVSKYCYKILKNYKGYAFNNSNTLT